MKYVVENTKLSTSSSRHFDDSMATVRGTARAHLHAIPFFSLPTVKKVE